MLLDLFERVEQIEADNTALKTELGTIYTHCDKCDRNPNCFKCGGTGVIKRSQLMSWRW